MNGIVHIIQDNIIINSIMDYPFCRVIYTSFANKLVIGKKEGIC